MNANVMEKVRRKLRFEANVISLNILRHRYRFQTFRLPNGRSYLASYANLDLSDINSVNSECVIINVKKLSLVSRLLSENYQADGL